MEKGKNSQTPTALTKMNLFSQSPNQGFFERVFEVVRAIPSGRVTTYGAIARYCGTGRSARMVGWALRASFSGAEYLPAHRVVNQAGVLTGKHSFGGEHVMAQLLESEGIIVEDDQVVGFNNHFWDPNKELI
jgi:methylated-DNA-protein-cysteine methyltransferase-like protein